MTIARQSKGQGEQVDSTTEGAAKGSLEVTTRELFHPSPKNAVLVCGLPGSGYVGKLAVEHLIDVFKGRRFMEFYSNSFPPHANVKDNGVATAIRGELYHVETHQAVDLLVFTADSQPTTSRGEYELCEAVLTTARALGATSVFSLAAYITGGFAEVQRVFGAGTSPEGLTRLVAAGVKAMKEGGISGMNGLIVGMARLYGMEGVCLLGETSGYMIDPGASEVVLDAFAKSLGIKVNMTTLKEKAKEAKQIIGQIQRMTEQESEIKEPTPSGQPGYIG